MPTDSLCPWPEDPAERLEAKLDAYHREMRHVIHGDAADGAKPGIDGRLRAVEKDVSTFKAGGALIGAGMVPMLFDWLRGKTGL